MFRFKKPKAVIRTAIPLSNCQRYFKIKCFASNAKLRLWIGAKRNDIAFWQTERRTD